VDPDRCLAVDPGLRGDLGLDNRKPSIEPLADRQPVRVVGMLVPIDEREQLAQPLLRVAFRAPDGFGLGLAAGAIADFP
jgi:hypothetical protein